MEARFDEIEEGEEAGTLTLPGLDDGQLLRLSEAGLDTADRLLEVGTAELAEVAGVDEPTAGDSAGRRSGTGRRCRKSGPDAGRNRRGIDGGFRRGRRPKRRRTRPARHRQRSESARGHNSHLQDRRGPRDSESGSRPVAAYAARDRGQERVEHRRGDRGPAIRRADCPQAQRHPCRPVRSSRSGLPPSAAGAAGTRRKRPSRPPPGWDRRDW